MKNIRNFCFFVFALIFLTVFSGHVFAQEEFSEQISISTTTQTNDVVPIATVNYYSGKVISQNGNKFVINFSIGNRIGVQTNVNYGIRLVYIGGGGDTLGLRRYGLKMYDDVLTLGENSKISRTVEYTAPKYLNGDFVIELVSYNAEGMPLSSYQIGEQVKLNGDEKYIDIDENTCIVSVEGDETKKLALEGIDVSSDETLIAECNLDNKFNEDKNVRIVYQIFDRNIYTKKVLKNENGEKFVVKNSDKTIKFVMPVMGVPQAYDVGIVLLNDDKQKISNDIVIHYVVQGNSATIQNIKLDKSYYNTGDIALVSFFVSGNANNFEGARKIDHDSLYGGKLKLNIENKEGLSCADDQVVDVEKKDANFSMKLSFEIKKQCLEPHIVVDLIDSKGDILDESEILVKLSEEENLGNNLEKEIEATTTNINNNSSQLYKTLLSVLFIIILIILIIVLYLKKVQKKDDLGTMAMFVVLVAGGLFMSFNVKYVSADTYYIENDHIIFSVNWPFAHNYNQSANITLSGVINSVMSCGNAVFNDVILQCGIDSVYDTVDLNEVMCSVTGHVNFSSRFPLKVCHGGFYLPKHLTAPNDCGSHKVTCQLHIDYTNSSGSMTTNKRLFYGTAGHIYTNGAPTLPAEFGFNVINCLPPPVNGACNPAFKDKMLASIPTAPLCSTPGAASAVTGGADPTISPWTWTWTCAGSFGGTSASCTAYKPLNVKITAVPPLPNVTQTVKFTATPHGGIPPYSNFSWTGAVSGGGTNVPPAPANPTSNYIEKLFGSTGVKTVHVSVFDLNGNLANDTLNITVGDNRVPQ